MKAAGAGEFNVANILRVPLTLFYAVVVVSIAPFAAVILALISIPQFWKRLNQKKTVAPARAAAKE